MNNQAAQTMPELPEPWTIRYHDDATGREIGPPTPLYTADQMHQYARDYAALSQTAGVADGPLSGKYGDVLRPFVIQMERELHANAGKGDRPGWLKMSPEVALLEIYYHLAKLQKAVKDNNGPGIQEYAADVANMSMMLLDICGGLALIEYAAPSASGGEYPGCSGDPASCPENEGHGCCKPNPARHVAIVCDWKNADPFPTFIEAEIGGKSVSLEWRDRPDGLKELIVPVTAAPQPPSAASVSERARELLAAEYRTHGWHEDAGRLCMGGDPTSFVEDDALRVITRLIEQGDEDTHVITELGRLLAGIAVILKGPEPAGTAWSYHDLPELVASALSEPRQVAAEMKAWAHTKMAEQQSSRRDRMMVAEWAKRLLPESSFPVKDFDVEGMSITKEAAREAVKQVALEQSLTQQRGEAAASGEGVDDTKRLDWIARQGGYEFDFGILNDQPGDGDWFVHGMGGSGQGATFRDAIDAAIKEEAGGQDANTDILDTLAFKTENGDAGRGSVTYIALVASGEAAHQQNAAQGGGGK